MVFFLGVGWGRCRGLGGPCALGEDMCGAAFLPTASLCHAEVGLPCLLISAERLVQECGLVNGGGDVDEAAWQGCHHGVGVGAAVQATRGPRFAEMPTRSELSVCTPGQGGRGRRYTHDLCC